MTPDLLDMPEIVLSKIMENVGVKALMTLRKVCHDLRNFIDDIKPDAKLKEMWIVRGMDNSICLYYKFAEDSVDYELRVFYKQNIEGCLVYNDNEESRVLLKNEDFITVSMKDFEIVLGHQKSVLKEFNIFGRFQENMDEILLENLRRTLKSRVQTFKVETFSVGCMGQNQLMSILPFLDSKTLKTLEIRNAGDELDFDQLIQLDQWKNIKQLSYNCYADLKYIHHFTQFTTNHFNFKTTHFPDLVALKDMILQSTGFRSSFINISEKYDLDDVQRSTKLLGQPLLGVYADTIKKRWFYRFPSTNDVLEICVTNEDSDSISLSRIAENDVPQNAVIHS